MRLTHNLHGGDTMFRRPAAYSITTAFAFAGRRRRIYDGLVELGGVAPGDRVLDVGCGPGYLTRRAARVVGPNGRVDGIDPSAEAIDHANRRAPANAVHTVAAAEELPYADDVFDAVLSSLAMHHISPDRRADAVGEMRRVLRPGGRLLIADLGPPTSRLASRVAERIRRHSRADHGVVDLPGLIADAGFDVTGQGDRPHRLRYVQARAAAG